MLLPVIAFSLPCNQFVSRRDPAQDRPLQPSRRTPWPRERDHCRCRRRRPRHFWDGTSAGELRLQRCDDCRHTLFPAAAVLPELRLAQGRGRARRAARRRLFSYVIHHRPAPGFTPPYAIAVVELDEGPRMMTNIVGCPQTPEALVLDMPLEVAFEKQTDQITLAFFKPAGSQ